MRRRLHRQNKSDYLLTEEIFWGGSCYCDRVFGRNGRGLKGRASKNKLSWFCCHSNQIPVMGSTLLPVSRWIIIIFELLVFIARSPTEVVFHLNRDTQFLSKRTKQVRFHQGNQTNGCRHTDGKGHTVGRTQAKRSSLCLKDCHDAFGCCS